ncbi:MAG TPA: ABC transporter substrate-binding protein [Methylomirabilota bacterium]|nr:ABC transporter substrate-binding protein [Methylomirabilota bacterium]
MAPRVVVILLLLIFSSLGIAHAQERKLEPLIVSYSSVTGNRAPLWIAKELGLYEKYGLDAKLVSIAAGNISLTALLAGDVHLTTDSSSGVVGAAARGAPIVTVSTNGTLPYQLIALPSIRSPADLKGKIVGSSRIGAGTDFLLRRILAKLNLVPGKDVSLIPTGVSESEKRIQLMFQGKIDATIGEADKVFQFTELGGQKISLLGEPKDFGVPAPGSEFNTTRLAVRELRPRLKAFFMAYSEAIATGRKNRELSYQVFRKYMRVDNPKLLDFTYRVQFLEAIPAKPYPREDAIQASIEDLKGTIPKLEGMKVSDFIDASLIREIENEGFFARLEKQ